MFHAFGCVFDLTSPLRTLHSLSDLPLRFGENFAVRSLE